MRNNKGFTLMEMLIIVGIIAILLAIGYPYFADVMEKNKENADIAAMHSAEALMETAYNTRLKIEGTSIRDAKATATLYYDPSGKLTWTRPAPYGQGTSRNGGATWSCCDDYQYDPSRDYRNGVIYCYYTPDSGTNPGIHVHWSVDGSSPTVPDPVTRPTRPSFPERPATEPTEGVTDDPGTGTITPVYPDTPAGSWTVEQVLTTGHPYPTTTQIGTGTRTDGFPVTVGHRYVYNGKIYAATVSARENEHYGYYTPDASPYGFVEITGPVYTSTDNLAPNGDVVVGNKESDKDQNGNFTQLEIPSGSIYIQYHDDDTVDFYVRIVSSIGTAPTDTYNDALWVKLQRPDACQDCGQIHLPQTGN